MAAQKDSVGGGAFGIDAGRNQPPFAVGDERRENSVRRVAIRLRVILAPLAFVSLCGLLVELAAYTVGLPLGLLAFFSLSYEANFPTWIASVLLFACSAALSAIASELSPGAAFRRHWWILALGFAYMSLDEAVELHEHAHLLVDPFVDSGGLFHFSWVIPAAIVVAMLALAYFPFVRHLEPVARRRFVLAGMLYVGGAVAMELPLGLWTESYGSDNLGYGLIDWFEETLELVGAGVFLWALLAFRNRPAAPPAAAEDPSDAVRTHQVTP